MTNCIKNFTPHCINVVDTEGKALASFPSEGIARVSSATEVVGELNGLPLTKTKFGEVEGLPEEKEGVFYIVSAMIKSTLPNRHDLLVPGLQVRDDQGRVIGCQSLGL